MGKRPRFKLPKNQRVKKVRLGRRQGRKEKKEIEKVKKWKGTNKASQSAENESR